MVRFVQSFLLPQLLNLDLVGAQVIAAWPADDGRLLFLLFFGRFRHSQKKIQYIFDFHSCWLRGRPAPDDRPGSGTGTGTTGKRLRLSG